MNSSSPHPKKPGRIHRVLASVVWQITPACREVTRLTSEERDHPLPAWTRLRLRLHRAFCVWCARYAAQLGLVHETLQDLGEAGAEELPEARKAQLKRELQGEAAARRLR